MRGSPLDLSQRKTRFRVEMRRPDWESGGRFHEILTNQARPFTAVRASGGFYPGGDYVTLSIGRNRSASPAETTAPPALGLVTDVPPALGLGSIAGFVLKTGASSKRTRNRGSRTECSEIEEIIVGRVCMCVCVWGGGFPQFMINISNT